MRFPGFLSKRARKASPTQRANQLKASSAVSEGAGSAWSTVLLMIGSALVGATAVAVWNRRTIAEIRTRFELGAEPEVAQTAAHDSEGVDNIF